MLIVINKYFGSLMVIVINDSVALIVKGLIPIDGDTVIYNHENLKQRSKHCKYLV